MNFLNEEATQTLQTYFADVNKKTTIVLFNEDGANGGTETAQVLRELVALKENFHLIEKDLQADAELAAEYGVVRAPAYVLLDEDDTFTRVRFNGVPLGHEINSLISAIAEVGGQSQEMPADMLERVKQIDKPVDIKVFVTLQCPHCPGAVQKAHALARHNPNIQAEMVEAESFPELSTQYRVGSVPHTVFNDGQDLIGNLPFDEFIKHAEQAANA